SESQITFKHQVVNDAGKNFKAAHYDHGTGVAIADIDGDGLLDIYFVNQLGGNELWRNLGGGKFENITAQAGVSLKGRVCVAASFADVDNDSRPDLFVTTVKMGNVLFHNLGGGRFEDVSKASGLDYTGHSSGAVFFDFNNDGWLDLFVCNVGVYTQPEKGPDGAYKVLEDSFVGHTHPERSEQSILYLNEGGLRFRNVSKEMHLEHSGWSGDAAFCDVNGDGFPDLCVLSMSGPDRLYLNNAGKSFAESTSAYFPKTSWGSMGLKFFDFDQDGRLDLLVTDMHSDMSLPQTRASQRNNSLAFEKVRSEAWCMSIWDQKFLLIDKTNFIFGNALHKNNGKLPWQDVSESANIETYWPWGISVADLNADGFEDVFVTAGMGHPFRYGINSLLLNNGGRRFFDAEFALGIEPRKNGPLIPYFTLDCSGADKTNDLCYHRGGELKVISSTSSRSSALCDLDNDGDLDLVINNMNDRAQMLLSNLSEKRAIHYLKIRLKGTKTNADGLGAVVKLTAGGRIWTQQHDGKSGYLSQSSLPLYFGLGDSSNIDKIEIRWPSAVRQTLAGNITPNRTLTIVEPAQ
ncbi:MAG TPA: CRTAC1 family protein, partial [Verrucomicrobiae bacterium]